MKREKEKIKIFIVDDHQLVIDGLCSLLMNESDFEIVGTTDKPGQLMAMMERKQVDILLTDVQMPEISGIELSRMVMKKHPGTYILALSMYGDIGVIRQMIDSGISGYILKNTGKNELLEALNKISKGQNYFSPEITRELMQAVKTQGEKKAHLTNREIEIIKLIAKDLLATSK
jgi:two-component system nitrate/nitrite response regulator NarL